MENKKNAAPGFSGFYYALAAIVAFSLVLNFAVPALGSVLVKGDEQSLVSTGNAMEMLSDVLAGVMYGFVFVFVLFTIKSCNAAKAADDIFTEKLPAGIRRFSLAMLVFAYVWTALNYWGVLSQYELHKISGCGAASAPRTPFGQGTIAFLLLIVFLLFIASVLRVAAGISKEHKYTV